VKQHSIVGVAFMSAAEFCPENHYWA